MRKSPDDKFTVGYHLGTVGTWVRLVIGVIAALALLVVDLSDVDGGFLAETGIWFAGILAVYTGAYLLMAPRLLPRMNPWASTVIFYGPVLVLPYVEAFPDPFRVAISLYVSVSVLVVVFVNYGGCEVIGIPSLLVRQRHVVYCPWNTVDLVDKAIIDSQWSDKLQSPAIKTTAILVSVALLGVGGLFLGGAFPLVWILTAIGSVTVVAIGVLINRSPHPDDQV